MKAKLQLNGLGGELVLASMSDRAFEYWDKQPNEKLVDYVLREDLINIPEFALFAQMESGYKANWFELDDLGHYYGAHPSHVDLVIDLDKDETGQYKTVMNSPFKSAISKTKSKLKNKSLFASYQERAPALQIYSVEKGCLFETEISLAHKEDFKQLVFHAMAFHTETLITEVEYQGVELDSSGGDTRGKGIYAKLCRV